MSVLVTGAAGFVGAHLVRELASRGMDVVAATLEPPSEETLARVGEAGSSVRWMELDVRDNEQAHRRVGELGVETIVHAASVTSSVDERLFVDVNVEGTGAMLHAAQEHRVRRFLYVSSSAVYGTTGAIRAPLLERDHALMGDGAYARSKIAAEKLCARYSEARDPVISIARLDTVYGPLEGQSEFRPRPSMVWRLLAAALSKPVVRVFGLSTRRPFAFVDDAARAIVDLALASPTTLQAFNIGAPEATSFNRLVEVVARVAPEVRFVSVERPEQAELAMTRVDARPILDTARLAAAVGTVSWRSLEDGVLALLNWFERWRG